MPYGFVNGSICKITTTIYNLHVSNPGYVRSNEVDYSDEPYIKMLHEKIKKTI